MKKGDTFRSSRRATAVCRLRRASIREMTKRRERRALPKTARRVHALRGEAEIESCRSFPTRTTCRTSFHKKVKKLRRPQSVVKTDKIEDELACNGDIRWHSREGHGAPGHADHQSPFDSISSAFSRTAFSGNLSFSAARVTSPLVACRASPTACFTTSERERTFCSSKETPDG